MKPETDETQRPLRTGLTTGSCATACTVAAAHALLAGKQFQSIVITLPRGEHVEMPITHLSYSEDVVTTATIKDGGDDPDATHGAQVWVQVRLVDAETARQQAQADLPVGRTTKVRIADSQPTQAGVTDSPVVFKAGEGVGTVTRSGLVIPVGEPAINPVPRKMIREHLRHLADVYSYDGGFEVTVGIEDGANIALKTMNPRLGIVGGLSILGTTGIVRPFSCAAYIASIHQGIDVARSNGFSHIAACTGNASEEFIADHYALPEMALVEMGDFAGAVLKYLRHNPVEKLSICGGFGKLSKLADGHLDLHSRASTINFETLADRAAKAGAGDSLQSAIKSANTSIEALALCQEQNIDLAAVVCRDALQAARQVVKQEIDIEVWAVDRRGNSVGHASA